MDTYTLRIAGCERTLPLCRLNDQLRIAAFVIFGDVELTTAAATALLAKAPAFDILLTAEAKGIPLAYEMARQSGKPYLVARKYPKLYMSDPARVTVKSITTDQEQTLYMDAPELSSMTDKRILVIDDVVSTGESLHGLLALVQQAGGTVAGKGCILAEGDAIGRTDLLHLEPLPLFPDA